MVLLIDRDNIDLHSDLMEEVYRFRHRAFVDENRWEALRKPDGREIDQFDTGQCFHLVGVEDDAVVSYSRFLPTVQPHLLSHVYPEILDGASYPTGATIWEWTRIATAKAKRDAVRGISPTSARLFVAGAEACQAREITAILGQGHPFMLTRMLELGWKVRPLALPQQYNGKPILPLYCGFDGETLSRLRKELGIIEPVLQIQASSAIKLPGRMNVSSEQEPFLNVLSAFRIIEAQTITLHARPRARHFDADFLAEADRLGEAREPALKLVYSTPPRSSEALLALILLFEQEDMVDMDGFPRLGANAIFEAIRAHVLERGDWS